MTKAKETKAQATETKTELDEILANEQTNTIEDMQTKLKDLAKNGTEEDFLSAYILYLQQKDFEEYNAGLKNNEKHFFLSNWFKQELIIRSAERGCQKASFKVSIQAVKALIGLAFLVEDNTLQYSFKPLDRNTYLLTFKIYSENMSNAQINYFNREYNLNIPENDKKEITPDEEQIDNNFTRCNVLKITN